MYNKNTWSLQEAQVERIMKFEKTIKQLFFSCIDIEKEKASKQCLTLLAGARIFAKGKCRNPHQRCCLQTRWISNINLSTDRIFARIKFRNVQNQEYNTESKYKWDIIWARIENEKGQEKELIITFKPHTQCPQNATPPTKEFPCIWSSEFSNGKVINRNEKINNDK